MVRLAWLSALALSSCGGASSPPPDDERDGVEATTSVAPPVPESEEPQGAVGLEVSPTSSCARRVEAMGAALAATATVTGLPPRDETSEEVARVPCEADEADDACLRRAERVARSEHGEDAELEFDLDGERREVRAVILVDGARVERTFPGTDELATFMAGQSAAGKRVVLEQMVAEIDPATRVVHVRRPRTIPPNDQRGRAQIVVPGTSAEVMRRVTDAAQERGLLVEAVMPLDGSVRVTIECP